MRQLTEKEVLFLDNEPIIVRHKEKGEWKDIAEGVESFMDMNDLKLKNSGIYLQMEEYGDKWVAFSDKE